MGLFSGQIPNIMIMVHTAEQIDLNSKTDKLYSRHLENNNRMLPGQANRRF